jgi:putative ABC transport system permease protein
MEAIKQRTPTAKFAAFEINRTDNVEVESNVLSNVRLYGVSEEFSSIQPIEIVYGRMMTDAEFDRGSNSTVVGYEIAEKLFGTPERAVGKGITTRGKTLIVAGVIKKTRQTDDRRLAV